MWPSFLPSLKIVLPAAADDDRKQGCQMATARFLDCMHLGLRAWTTATVALLRYTAKFDPFQFDPLKGSKFPIWQHWSQTTYFLIGCTKWRQGEEIGADLVGARSDAVFTHTAFSSKTGLEIGNQGWLGGRNLAFQLTKCPSMVSVIQASSHKTHNLYLKSALGFLFMQRNLATTFSSPYD